MARQSNAVATMKAPGSVSEYDKLFGLEIVREGERTKHHCAPSGEPGHPTEDLMNEPATALREVIPTESAQREPAANWIIWLLRLFVTLHTMLIFLQPYLAGSFVTGNLDFLTAHAYNAEFVVLAVFLQLVATILLWRPGRGRAWPIFVTISQLVLTEVQIAVGYLRQLAVHFSLGTTLISISVLMFVWVWRGHIDVTPHVPNILDESK